MTKIIWTSTALHDLKNIHDYIALDSEIYAEALVADVFNAVEQLTLFPHSGRTVPEMKRFREIFVGHYRIIYSPKSKNVYIMTIFHGSKRI